MIIIVSIVCPKFHPATPAQNQPINIQRHGVPHWLPAKQGGSMRQNCFQQLQRNLMIARFELHAGLGNDAELIC